MILYIENNRSFCIIWFVSLSLCISVFPLLIFVPQWPGAIASRIESQQRPPPSVIVIGAGISGIAAARSLYDASYKVSYHYSFVFFGIIGLGEVLFLLSALAYFHHLVRWLYWSLGIGLVVAFIRTTHLVVLLTWEPHGMFNLFYCICCT